MIKIPLWVGNWYPLYMQLGVPSQKGKLNQKKQRKRIQDLGIGFGWNICLSTYAFGTFSHEAVWYHLLKNSFSGKYFFCPFWYRILLQVFLKPHKVSHSRPPTGSLVLKLDDFALEKYCRLVLGSIFSPTDSLIKTVLEDKILKSGAQLWFTTHISTDPVNWFE